MESPLRPTRYINSPDSSPDQKGRNTTQVDNVRVGGGSTGAQVHQREAPEQVGRQDGPYGNTSLVDVSKDLGGHTFLAHVTQSSTPNVDRTVDRGEAGDEDERVDQVNTALPAGLLDGDGHGRLERTGFTVDESLCVGGTGCTEEQGAAHVDEEDTPEDLSDGHRDGLFRVFGLCAHQRDRLDTGVDYEEEVVRSGRGGP
jgi:hypothetical protein